MKVTVVLITLCFATACSAEPAVELPLDSSPVDRENPAYLTSYAPVLKPARAAVVSVYTANLVRVWRQRGIDPRDELFRRYYGLPSLRGRVEAEERWQPGGIGSGVIIASDGHIITNNHVISAPDGDAADEVLVQLTDGRELSAEVVGRDPASDLAILRVDADELPAIQIADSDQLEVGDIVFAIGNPMGVGLTITQGIVSATGRSNLAILGESGYESFIQTDASINPGNSGGALVDAYGRLIGINTAIISRDGGNVGIGFAIPSTFARTIALRLLADGEVRRGMLGVSVADLTEDTIEVFQLPMEEGALVQSVARDLPAANAGIKPGDVIVSIGGQAVSNASELRLTVASHPPGDTVAISYYRDGELVEGTVELVDSNDPYGFGARAGELLRGVETVLLDRQTRAENAIDVRVSGLLITDVDRESSYAEYLPVGCVITEINGEEPLSVSHAIGLLEGRRTSRLYIYFKGQHRYLTVRPD
ncbi:MAG: S1C family serine protease [Coraliomargarita sp.]